MPATEELINNGMLLVVLMAVLGGGFALIHSHERSGVHIQSSQNIAELKALLNQVLEEKN